MAVMLLLMIAMLVLATPSVAIGQEVTRVVNGETIEVAGVGRVRLVGIDADGPAVRFGPSGPPAPPRTDPARQPPQPAITGSAGVRSRNAPGEFLQRLVLGKRVRLEYDAAASKGRGHPRAYVYLEDDSLVNEEMLEAGYARVDTSRPFSRQRQFQEIEAAAREARLGIWAEETRRR